MFAVKGRIIGRGNIRVEDTLINNILGQSLEDYGENITIDNLIEEAKQLLNNPDVQRAGPDSGEGADLPPLKSARRTPSNTNLKIPLDR